MNFLRYLHKIPQRQLQPVFKLPVRPFMRNPLKFNETEDKWRYTDGVSKNWNLIYKAPMVQWLNYTAAYLTLSTAAMTGGAIYYAAFVFDPEKLYDPVLLGEDVIVANSPLELSVYAGAFVIFHIAVKVLLSKYVIRLYQQDDKYLAVFRGHMLNTIKKHEFHLNDFKKLNPTFVVSWGDARFSLGNKHGILLENYFKTPAHFNYLLNKRKNNNPEHLE